MEKSDLYILLIALALPFISFIISFLIPNRLEKLIPWLATAVMSVGLVSATLLFYSDGISGFTFRWFSVGTADFSVDLKLRGESVTMLMVVYAISWIVHLYSIGYITKHKGLKRYFGMLGFFTFSMAGVVVADNLLLLFIFWELVGFASYILIGHWFEKEEAGTASLKAFLFNRVGDVIFLVGLLLIYSQTRTFSITELSTLDSADWFAMASLCIFCGVIGKSAQLPLFSWLPSAMVGPTPVSALIHAATMVAAGVYLLLRVHFLFTPVTLNIVALAGISTAIIGSISAIAQYDIKKILA
ncbi:MAG: NADH-quinone oxidoreductase subunit L, partial [Flammeovirgaceae bacterium]|nr:NADH-quinone oxidoreductase subunit L [Flammeovirgaceae bacterium]